MDSLKQTIQSLLPPGGTDVIISFCNYGFVDFIFNLISCFTKLGIHNYLIFSLDQKSHEVLQKKNINSYLFEKKEAVYTEETSNFGEVGFKAICNEKPYLVLEVVKLGFNVLWTDSDIVWLDDAMKFMKGDYDLILQRDDDDICAGFFYIRSNPAAIQFMTKVVDYLNPMIDDQIAMRRFLKEKDIGVTHLELDRIMFPNGTAYFNMKLPQKANKIPVIIHNNCIIGHDSKKERFKLHNLWFVDDQIPANAENNNMNNNIECTKILKGHHDIVTTVHVIDQTLYSASLDKNIICWDIETGNKLATRAVHPRGAVWGLASLPHPHHVLFTASHDRTCQSWSTKEWKQLATYAGHSTIVNSVCVSQSKNMLFTSSDDQSIRGYDLETGVKKKIYTGHTGWVSSLCVDGGVLFSASQDSTARAWEISTGRELVIYQGHTGWVRSVAVHGNLVFTGSNDTTVRCWNMRDGTTARILRGHTASVSCVCTDNNGILYSGSDDNSIRAWNVETGACIAVYTGHTGWVTSLTITGKILISSSFDKTIRFWPACTK